MIKILIIAPCPYNLNNIKGGVEAVTVNLLQGFQEIDEIEMLIVSIRKEIQKEEIVKYSNNIQIQYIPDRSISMFLKYPLLLIFLPIYY